MALSVPSPDAAADPDRRSTAIAPALAAIAYPLLLQAFHAVVTAPAGGGAHLLAAALLAAAFAMPACGLGLVLRTASAPPATVFAHRVRLLGLLAFAAPPLLVFIAFPLGQLGHPVPEFAAWAAGWAGAAAWVWRAPALPLRPSRAPGGAPRALHGAIAALVLAYIAFHLANHLLGLAGPEVHRAVMAWGRRVYRAPAVEAALVGLLLAQVGLGAWLASRWSRRALDSWRAAQLV